MGEWMYRSRYSWSRHFPAALPPWRRVGPRAGLDAVEKRKIPCPYWDSNPSCPARSHRCTDCAIPAVKEWRILIVPLWQYWPRPAKSTRGTAWREPNFQEEKKRKLWSVITVSDKWICVRCSKLRFNVESFVATNIESRTAATISILRQVIQYNCVWLTGRSRCTCRHRHPPWGTTRWITIHMECSVLVFCHITGIHCEIWERENGSRMDHTHSKHLCRNVCINKCDLKDSRRRHDGNMVSVFALNAIHVHINI
jgi:hypothetical protein